MFCEKCGTSIPEGADTCPNCGEKIVIQEVKEEAPVQTETTEAKETTEAVETEATTETAETTDAAETAATPETEVPVETVETQETPATSENSEAPVTPASSETPEPAETPEAPKAKPEKGKGFFGFVKSHLVLCIVAVAVVAVAIVCAVNHKALANGCAKLFKDEAGYYRYVEKNYLKSVAKDVSEAYKITSDYGTNVYDQTMNGALTLELFEKSDKFLKYLGDLTSVDLTWLKKIELSGKYYAKGLVFGSDASLKVNGKGIVSLNAFYDQETGRAFLKIPEVDGNYIVIDKDMVPSSDSATALSEQTDPDELDAYEKALPSKAKVAKLLNKYIDIALKQIDNVQESSGKKVKVGAITDKYTVLEVEIDEETVKNIIISVSEALKEDTDVRESVVALGDAANEYGRIEYAGEKLYEDFLKALDKVIKNAPSAAKEYADYNAVSFKIYVNGKGEIVGRTVAVSDISGSREDIRTYSYILATKGSEYSFESYLKEDTKRDGKKEGDSNIVCEMSSSGTKHGDKYTGDVTFVYNDKGYTFNIEKLDYSKVLTGVASGKIELPFDQSVITNIAGQYTGMLVSTALSTYFGSDLSFDLDFSTSKNKSNASLTAYTGEDKILTLSFSSKYGKGKKATLPNEKKATIIKDNDDLMAWATTLDLSGITKRLDKAGAGEDITDLIDDLSDQLSSMGKYYK